MKFFEDILLTVDFDRTLTGTDATIPQRNLDAIAFFMENGGAFTVNTGRSPGTFWQQLESVPVNAPFLMYNGGAAYHKGELTVLKEIQLDLWQTVEKVRALFPDMHVAIEGEAVQYLVDPAPDICRLYDKQGWRYTPAQWGQNTGPFVKFMLFGQLLTPEVAEFYRIDAAEQCRLTQIEQMLRELFGEQVEVTRAAPRIIDVQAKGVSKCNAARWLQKKLGKKHLVCVGDAKNDISMLDGADYAYCPADAELADRYETVCPCDQGAVADVIYKKIPEILGMCLDIPE